MKAEFNHNLMAEMQNLDLAGDGLIIGDHQCMTMRILLAMMLVLFP